MGRKEIFDSGDDVHRLPILPSGFRDHWGIDGVLHAGIDYKIACQPLTSAVTDELLASAPGSPGEVLERLGTVGRLRSMLDAVEAVLLAEGLELSYLQDRQKDITDPLQLASIQKYGVKPGSEQVIRQNFVAEASLATRTTEYSTNARLLVAEGLRQLCPRTLEALLQGQITTRSAITVIRSSQDLQPEQVGQLEQNLLPVARRDTDAQVSKRAKKLRTQMLPEAPATRRERRVEERYVRWWAEPDGMAALQACLPAEDIMAIMKNITAHANEHREPDEQRSDAQLHADVFRDVLIQGWPDKPGPGVRVKLHVLLPAVQLLAAPGTALAELQGYGPIPAPVALALARHAPSFARVLTDPWDGAPIDVGRTRYRPPAALQELVQLRDEHCQFPGCRRPAERCEIDHVKDWAKGGATTRDNTKLLCTRHQMFKHALRWQSQFLPDGSVRWESPNGLVHFSDPGSLTTVNGRSNYTMSAPSREAVYVDEKLREVLALHEVPPGTPGYWHDPSDPDLSSQIPGDPPPGAAHRAPHGPPGNAPDPPGDDPEPPDATLPWHGGDELEPG